MFVKGRFSTDFFDHFEYNRPCGLSNWRSLRAALLFCVLALIFCGATAIICPLTEYGGVLKWSKRRDSKSRRPGNWCMGSNPISSARKRQVSTETCRFQLNPPLRVGEIVFDDEIQLRWMISATFGGG